MDARMALRMAYLVTVDDERVRVKPRFRVGFPFKFAPTLDELYQVAIQSRRNVSSIHPLSVWQVRCIDLQVDSPGRRFYVLAKN